MKKIFSCLIWVIIMVFLFAGILSNNNIEKETVKLIDKNYQDYLSAACSVSVSKTNLSFYTNTGMTPSSASFNATLGTGCVGNGSWSIYQSQGSAIYGCSVTGSSSAAIVCQGKNGVEISQDRSSYIQVKYKEPNGTSYTSSQVSVTIYGTDTQTTNYVISINRDGGQLGSSDFTYSSDGGIGSYTYSKTVVEKSITIKLPTSGTKSGYTFGGIYTGPNCTGTKQGASVTINSTDNYKTFYACWASSGASITLNPNGGSLTGVDSVYSNLTGRTSSWTTSYGSLPAEFDLSDVIAKRNGYAFNGWGTSASCTSGSSGKITFSTNKAYYACWVSAGASITLNPNGGSLIGVDSVYSNLTGRTSTWTTTYGSLPAEFDLSDVIAKRSGYIFKGWGSNASCTSGSSSKITFNTNTTYYACWSKSSSGTTYPTISVPTPIEEKEYFTDTYRYVIDGLASIQGNPVSCGDYVKVIWCDKNTTEESKCEIASINNIAVSTTTLVKRQHLGIEPPTGCGTITRVTNKESQYYTNSSLTGTTETLPCGTTVTLAKLPKDACVYQSNQFCEVVYNNNTIYVNRAFLGILTSPACEPAGETCTPEAPKTEVKGQTFSKICYTVTDGVIKENGTKLLDSVTCAAGYIKTIGAELENTCSNLKNSSQTQECHITNYVECRSGARPNVGATGSFTNNDNYGSIIIQATDNDGSGITGYFISSGDIPLYNSKWIPFDNTNYRAIIPKEAGTYFIWVKNNSGNMSLSVLAKIHDAEVTTTLKQVEFQNEDGSIAYHTRVLDDNSTIGYNSEIINERYVRLSNKLNDDSLLADGFQQFSTAYEINDVKSNKIAIYATLTSNDANYEDGYGPRTIDLNYGRNVALIKVVNNKGKTRTYTFIINRVDDRESNNLLSDISLSIGKIKFDSYVSNYDVVVPKNTKKVSINATLTSEYSSFVEGYQPRTVNLETGITSAVVKTISQAGITRSYVLTFIKSGTDTVTNLENSVYLGSLSVPGTEIEFDRETFNYSVSSIYEVEDLPIFAFAESSKAVVSIEGNFGLRIGSNNINITVVNGSKTKVYTVTIIRKEAGLNVADDITLGTLTIKNYPINFDPNVLDYTVKIKREKTLLITATPNSNRSEVYMYGNNDLTAYSTVRIKVIAENGETAVYSVDIKKDLYNKALEITAGIVGSLIVIGAGIIIVVHRKRKKLRDYIGS